MEGISAAGMHGFVAAKDYPEWQAPLLVRACDALARPGYNSGAAHEYLDTPEVLRAKDRLSPTTHINGLRDALLNLIVPDTDSLVVELQLHFKKLHAISE